MKLFCVTSAWSYFVAALTRDNKLLHGTKATILLHGIICYYFEIVVFCIRDYISRILIRSILMEFSETSDCTDESRKDETCLQLFKMKKHYIKT